MSWAFWFHFQAVFVVMALLDWVWAKYVTAVKDHSQLRASWLASLIMLLNGLVTLAYVEHPVMVLPAMVGAFVGTYFGSKRQNTTGGRT